MLQVNPDIEINKSQSKITILLASYNGEKYIRQQIESIINQTYTNWKLFVRDDCSNDATLQILEEYVNKDKRISIVNNDNKRLGACMNFAELMEVVDCTDYIMFSDQDDVWFNEKIQKTIDVFLKEEHKYGSQTPILVHTDFQFVNDNLQKIEAKENIAVKFSNEPEKIFNKLLSQNYIGGCTMMINTSLLKRCIPVSIYAENHDYWIALIASATGKIFYLPEKTMYYRQHSSNLSPGIKASSFYHRINRLILNRPKAIKVEVNRIKQIFAIKNHLNNNISEDKKILLDMFLNIVPNGGFRAIYFAYKNGIKRRGIIQTILYYTFIWVKRDISIK